MNDEIGPNPKAWLSTNFSQMELINISIKTFSVLSGEQGLIPESLVVLPFPSLGLKGLIKYIIWDDETRRGSIGQAAIVLFFQEGDDVIFYKYITLLSTPFEEIYQKITDAEKTKAPREIFVDILTNLEKNVSNLLDEFRIQENTQFQGEQFPEQQVIDRSLINYQFKIIIVGDPSVGKTSLILRYTNNAFRRSYVPTMGVHVSNKIFKIDDSLIQLTLWDIGGQTKFHTMRQQFYRGSDAVFLLFDLTNPESFNNIPRWFSDVSGHLSDHSEVLMGFIIGNKKDLVDKIMITSEMETTMAAKLNLGFIETSALLGENVDYAFSTIANLLFKSRL
ncbi:hypothetical protein LCGC14_1957320 [marine sediment metagenome]|uniref:GTP-binding protein n=1 Tax=marine sediment metagenome TaxID=412755 RepID=A0A0F9HU02_9ZZZZ